MAESEQERIIKALRLQRELDEAFEDAICKDFKEEESRERTLKLAAIKAKYQQQC